MYATTTAVLAMLPGFPQTASSRGYTATLIKIGTHITRAESLVNSKISERYDVTQFTSTASPPILTHLTEDIAAYYMLRSEYSGDNQNVNEWVDKFQEAKDILEEIREGKAHIVNSTGTQFGASTTIGTVESTTENWSPTFNEGDPLNWQVDQEKLDDLNG